MRRIGSADRSFDKATQNVCAALAAADRVAATGRITDVGCSS
jgi:hypothetical protein